MEAALDRAAQCGQQDCESSSTRVDTFGRQLRDCPDFTDEFIFAWLRGIAVAQL
jgi:hypothetical protein